MMSMTEILGVGMLLGALVVLGCGKPSESNTPESTPAASVSPKPAGVGERTGVVVDRAVEKTVEVGTVVASKAAEAVKASAVVTKDVAARVVEKTGESLEQAGALLERTGEDMQKK